MIKGPALIYLDVCTVSRPFDDQSYLRIRLETEAVNMILSKIREGTYRLMVSPVHVKEIEAISDVFERIELLTVLRELGKPIKVNMAKARARAEELVKLHFGVADAAHVGFAEACMAQFVSCDDILIKKCLKYKISTWCGNPVAFCEKERLK